MAQIVFFDIDNTLRSKRNYKIPESAKQAVQALKNKGYVVGIATGRGLYSARMFMAELNMDFAISEGGRTVLYDGKIIYSNVIHDEIVDRFIQYAYEANVDIGFSNHYGIHSTSDAFSKAFDLDQTIICNVKKEIDVDLLFGLSKIYLWGDKETIVSSHVLDGIEHHWLREKLCVIEHMHKDEGIEIIKNVIPNGPHQVISFGDDLNDITMFQKSNIAICMGNGVEEAKKYATYVTDDIDNDGLLKACLHLKLIDKEDL